MLPNICEASQLPCTRTRGLTYIATHGSDYIPFYSDEEPADVVHWYDLFLFER